MLRVGSFKTRYVQNDQKQYKKQLAILNKMAHCFDIHKSDRPCPHAPPEKQKHVLCVIIFELKVCGMQGLDPEKFVRVELQFLL
jgi:hypothetical protein